MIKSKLLVSGAALCAAISFSAEAKLFKWVDDSGTTHYGETIPPEYANKEAVKLEKGHIEKRDSKQKTAEEKAAIKDPAAEKARIEAKRHDEALINTYSNEKEIDLARDRNLLQIEARVNSFATMLRSAQETLAGHHKEEENITKQGRKIPTSLTEDIAEAEARVAKLQKDFDLNQKDLEAVKARYVADKLRYRELKGQTTSAP